MIQGSPEWISARLGRVTASRISDVMATGRGGNESTSRSSYKMQLAVERITNEQMTVFVNSAMEWGTQTEPAARSAYEATADVFVEEVGMISHPSIKMAGASPDGLVGEDGLVEIKCPTTKTHQITLDFRTAPEKYIPQMQWQMACTGRSWCDFVSFDPRVDTNLQLFICRVHRDDKLIEGMESAVICFLSEVDDLVMQLNLKKESNEKTV